MNTLQIKKYLETNKVTRNIFLNVYAADQLPKEKLDRDRWLLVCNCCPANRRGEHWVAMFYENGTLEFFDSFGLPIENYAGVEEFIRVQKPSKVISNTIQLQSSESDVCGYYCIYYGYSRADEESMEQVLNNLSYMSRDTFVKHIVTFNIL